MSKKLSSVTLVLVVIALAVSLVTVILTIGMASGDDNVGEEAGKSAFDLAKENGYTGTESQWLSSLIGANGADGKSAYELACDLGYTGSQSEWLASLVGNPGTNGLDGKTAYELAVEFGGFDGTLAEWLQSLSVVGPEGPQGIQGPQGPAGQDGQQGVQGPQGETGQQGQQGPAGQDGANGVDGADGSVWYYGATDPVTVANSKSGDYYINTATGIAYFRTADATETWTQVANLKGPQGEQGQQGEQGSPGPQGPAGQDGANGVNGADGSVWYYGTTDPATVANSKSGDYFINTTSGDVFYRTTAETETWAKITNLKGLQGEQGQQGEQGSQGPQGEPGQDGANGVNGADGSVWYYGTTDPATVANSKSGDYFINTITGDIFFRITDVTETWTKITNLKGLQGSQGPQGEPGQDGANGVNGADGSVWYYGATDPVTVANSKSGDYYINTATGIAYFRTADATETWTQVANLKGPQGEQGQQGEQGSQGPQGEPGQDGANGVNGADGSVWYYGATDPVTVANSKSGDYYINTATGIAYFRTADATETWTQVANLKGPQGEQGEQGEQGPQGDQGEPGQNGQNGQDGAAWISGETAPTAGTGKVGDFYLNTTNGKLYNKTDATTWTFVTDTQLTNPFANKTYTAIGDSITQANGNWTTAGTNPNYTNENGFDTGYVPRVGDLLGFENVYNIAYAGSTFVDWATNGLGQSSVTTADVITVMLGTNDYGVSTPMGTYEERKNNTYTLYGAAYAVMRTLVTSNPTATIIIITPIPRNNGGTGDAWHKTNNAGYTLEDVANVLIRLANEFALPVLDLYRVSGMNEHNYTNFYQGDMLHIKTGGYEKITPLIADFIKAPVTTATAGDGTHEERITELEAMVDGLLSRPEFRPNLDDAEIWVTHEASRNVTISWVMNHRAGLTTELDLNGTGYVPIQPTVKNGVYSWIVFVPEDVESFNVKLKVSSMLYSVESAMYTFDHEGDGEYFAGITTVGDANRYNFDDPDHIVTSTGGGWSSYFVSEGTEIKQGDRISFVYSHDQTRGSDILIGVVPPSLQIEGGLAGIPRGMTLIYFSGSEQRRLNGDDAEGGILGFWNEDEYGGVHMTNILINNGDLIEFVFGATHLELYINGQKIDLRALYANRYDGYFGLDYEENYNLIVDMNNNSTLDYLTYYDEGTVTP